MCYECTWSRCLSTSISSCVGWVVSLSVVAVIASVLIVTCSRCISTSTVASKVANASTWVTSTSSSIVRVVVVVVVMSGGWSSGRVKSYVVRISVAIWIATGVVVISVGHHFNATCVTLAKIMALTIAVCAMLAWAIRGVCTSISKVVSSVRWTSCTKWVVTKRGNGCISSMLVVVSLVLTGTS